MSHKQAKQSRKPYAQLKKQYKAKAVAEHNAKAAEYAKLPPPLSWWDAKREKREKAKQPITQAAVLASMQ